MDIVWNVIYLVAFGVLIWGFVSDIRYWWKTRNLKLEDVVDEHVYVLDSASTVNDGKKCYIIDTKDMSIRDIELLMRRVLQRYEESGAKVKLENKLVEEDKKNVK
tara:strand:+ start:3135 stop:3449 length:315 start_codon:yes stop_codon:yes gene_type:complete